MMERPKKKRFGRGNSDQTGKRKSRRRQTGKSDPAGNGLGGTRRQTKGAGRSLPQYILIFLAVIVLIIWMISGIFSGGGTKVADTDSQDSAQTDQTDDEVPDWIVQQFLTINEYSRPGIALEQVNGIVIHYVANAGSTGWENWHYFEGLAESHETKAGAHFIIGLDGTVIQCVPLDELTYCSNSRNVDTISIECCHPEEDGKFTDETYDSLVKLCRWLMEKYDLSADDVIRHYDVTGKLCPLYFVEHEEAWEAFKEELE